MALMDGQQDREQQALDTTPSRADDAQVKPRDVGADQVNTMLDGVYAAAAGTQHAKAGGAGTGGTATSSAARLTDFATGPDLGEQVVGTDHDHQFLLPMNIHGDQATASIIVNGDAFSLQSAAQVTLLPTTAKDFWSWHSGYSPRIKFAPTRPGKYAATLTVVVAWPDSHVETRTMTITATARDLDQVGKRGEVDEENAEGPAAVAKDVAQGKEVSEALAKVSAKSSLATAEQRETFAAERADAIDAANGLTERQSAGIRRVADEAVAYQKQAPMLNRSFWKDLAEIGLQMATGGLANFLAKGVAPRVGAAMGKAVERILTPSDAKEKSPMEHFIDQLEASAKADAAKELPKLGAFTGDALRTGLKSVMGNAVGKLTGKGQASKGDAGGEMPAEHGHSANARIDFFEEQYEIVSTTGDGYKDLVREQAKHFRPVLDVAPDEAIEAVRALKEEFINAKAEAANEHANATAPSWVALVARSTLGTDTIEEKDLAPGVDGARVADHATEMASLRSSEGATASGVLDLTLDKNGPGAKVVGARLLGVAQELVARLVWRDPVNKRGARPLRELRIPIRLIMGTNLDRPTIVTIDEAGRIRATGNYEQLANHRQWSDSATTEAEAYRGTEALVERLLDETLASYGIEVEHDDATGLGG